MKTDRKSKSKKEVPLNLKKIKYIVGLVLLVAAAFQLPMFLFTVQDRERMHSVGCGSRQNTNFAALEENYEPSVFRRLYDFAEGVGSGKSYYVSEMSAALSEREQTELLEQTFFENDTRWFLNCAETAWRSINKNLEWGFGWYFNREVDQASGWTVTELKKYVIYDAEKVNFICWYLEVELDGTHTIKALVDTEDGTVYYIQGIRKYSGYEKAVYTYDAAENIVGTGYTEKNFYKFRNMEPVALLWAIAMDVYEADWEFAGVVDQRDVQVILKDESDSAVDYWIRYGEILDGIGRSEMESREQLLMQVEQKFELSGNRFTLPLYYYGDRELPLEAEFDQPGPEDKNEDAEMRYRIGVGIAAIGELIPEFKQ